MAFDHTKLQEFADLPGVYLMKSVQGEVLYVGKAKNLRARIKQYFAASRDERTQIPFLVNQIETIETIVVNSEKEALLLENTLIKKHRPRYNILLKDDKGYISLELTTNHKWPMVRLIRYKGKPPEGGKLFGPYVNAAKARELFDIVGRLFPLRQCSDEEFARRTKPCLLYQMKRCSAPCVGLVSQKEYLEYVQETINLFRGKDTETLHSLEKEMQRASDALEFEKAAEILRKIRLLQSIGEKQSVERVFHSEMDVWGICREGKDVVINKLIYRNHRLIGSYAFMCESAFQNDEELACSLLLQHYLSREGMHELPKEIIFPFTFPDILFVEEIFKENLKTKIEITILKKGEGKKLLQLAHINALYAFKQKKDIRAFHESVLLDMQERLKLTRFPKRIECFDNSHLAGKDPVSSMVVFVDGQKCPSEYRKFRIKTAKAMDDYGMLRETLMRRCARAKEEGTLPDLLVVDGGKGHLGIAEKVLSLCDITSCDVIALAKEEGRHDKGQTKEKVYTRSLPHPIELEPSSPLLLLLQKLRDEAHRFTITYQKSRRSKAMIKSALDHIPGIGAIKKQRLLRSFGSVKAIQEKSIDDLLQIKGITRKDAETLLKLLNDV